MGTLDGQVAVVTGGTRGIGRAIAESLLDRGASVAIGARTGSAVERAAEELGRRGHALGVTCDVRDATACERLVSTAAETFGRLDILVNNAGIGVFGAVHELSVGDWLSVLETNLNGVFFCCRAAIPHLRRSGGGWIINIGSLAGKNAFPGGAAYNASKFGLIGFSEALMQDVRHEGIRVSYIMPGSVAGEFRGPAEAGAGREWKLHPEDVARAVTDLLAYPDRALASRVELRPSRPPRK